MKKEEVLALVADKKVAAGVVFDDISAAVDSIEISIVGSDEELQKALDQAKADLAAVQAELDALKLAKSQEDVDLESVKADLADKVSKLANDEDKLAKLKAILLEAANS